MERKVNLFIVGAAKAGTTSLRSYLNQHPDIFFTPLKEPNFFARDIDPAKFTAAYKKRNAFADEAYFKTQPLPELHISFIQSPLQYIELFRDSDQEKYIGESSTAYLYSSVAANKIHEYNPDAKIIVLLRNPISRAFSHYTMALQGGYTDLNFREAIEKDIKKHEKGFGISDLFIDLGLYSQQLKRFYSSFPLHQIKIVLYDDFKLDSNQTLNELFAWLEIGPILVNTHKQMNVSLQPKSKKWNKLLSDIGIKKIASNVLSNSFKQKIKSTYYSTKLGNLSEADKIFLLSIYKDDIKETAEIINKDLSNWLRI